MVKSVNAEKENLIMGKLALLGGEKAICATPEYRWPIITADDKEYLLKMVEENEISYNFKSEEIDRLEMNFKEYLQIPFCLALNSGTSALYTAFIAIGISEGDEVIVPSYTFPASVIPLIHLGAKIIFADSEKDTPLISIEDVKKKVTKNTKLILVSHMDGFPVQVHLLRRWLIKHEYDALILEDCAQAIGAEVDGEKVGALGDLAIFSFQQKKLLTGGEGGLLVTNNKDYYERAILLSYLQKRSFDEISTGRLQQYCYTGLGFNFRIHPFAAGMVNQQFSRMEQYANKRRENMELFKECFNDISEVKFIDKIHENTLPSYFSFKFLYVEEDIDITRYVQALNAEGVPIVVSTTRPLHLEPIFLNMNNNKFSMDFLNEELSAQLANPLIECESYSKKC